ncbi:DUF3455 domain-containing protein [Rhodopila sp.]|uniref:DUF3455 domain-containing protein n=1 Tax=Rhodopila sp. TaxID=2480087 RepID=UPI003D10A95B
MNRHLRLLLLAAVLLPLDANAAEPPGSRTPGSGTSGSPAGSAVEFLGKGEQIYTCAVTLGAATSGGAAWKLKAPEATLLDASGHVVGRHFAGPTWQASDGSKVVGTPLIASASPDPGAITWLVLRATAHDGAGLFASVAYIARTRTVGGVAPATGCDGSHQGAEIRVPYSATYTFFKPVAP